MKSPRPTLTPSRLNVGGYGVRVCERWQTLAQRSAIRYDVFTRELMYMGRVSPARTVEECETALIDFVGPHPPRLGVVTPDGSLTLQPDPWAARHYRRAVMRGAGVYRAGLWAYLAAGRGLQFPTPESGARVEPHTVRVRGFAEIPARVVTGSGAARRVVIQPVKMCTADEGTVTADGLALSRGEWQDYALQEAMSKGAGVFLAGLWAHLGGTREGGAALGVNGPQVLERFTTAAHGRVRHSVRWRTARKRLERQAHRARRLTRIEAHMLDTGRRPLWGGSLKREQPRRTWQRQAAKFARGEHLGLRLEAFCGSWESSPGDPDYLSVDPEQVKCMMQYAKWLRHREACPLIWHGKKPYWQDPEIMGAALGVGRFMAAVGEMKALREFWRQMKAARATLAPVLAAIIKRGDAYRAHLARMVKARRHPVRAPRPLYAHPRPPAAPLAPPAL